MKPRRTHESNFVFVLEGGNEDNDLWVERAMDPAGIPTISSVWEPTGAERAAIAAGDNIELTVLGAGHPPVAMRTTDVALGKAPEAQ